MQKNTLKTVIVLVGAGLFGLYQHFQKPDNISPSRVPSSVMADSKPTGNADNAQTVAKIRAAANNPDAKFWTTVQGTIVKSLKDDREGNQHQRFLVALAPDITLLVAHNTELAQRVPITEGQAVTISGEYVWNNRGGVLHWTHHDPRGRKGGWIEVAGKRYE
jgi:hypothetical protein